MATTRSMTGVQVRQRILDEYQLLVDFDGPFPTSVSPPSSLGENESWKSWCNRVLGQDATNVRAYLATADIRGQTKLKTLVNGGAAPTVKALIRAGKLDAKVRTQKQQTLAAKKADKATGVLRQQERRAAAKIEALQAADAASGLQSFADDLDARLATDASAPPGLALDVKVQERARALLADLTAGKQTIDLFWDLLKFCHECRKLVSSTTPPPPPQSGR